MELINNLIPDQFFDFVLHTPILFSMDCAGGIMLLIETNPVRGHLAFFPKGKLPDSNTNLEASINWMIGGKLPDQYFIINELIVTEIWYRGVAIYKDDWNYSNTAQLKAATMQVLQEIKNAK